MRSVPAVLAIGCFMIGACTGSSSSEPQVTAPLPTTAPDSLSPSTVETSTVPSTTESTPPTITDAPPASAESSTSTPGTTTSTAADNSDRYLPDGLGIVVDSAPGVDSPGEVTELIDNVWFFVPSEPVEGDANVVPPLPEDREILIAYAEAQAAYHEQASLNPIPTEPSDRLAAALADGGLRLMENVLSPAAANGQYLDLAGGIVLRPVVIADPRSDTEAFIFDCQLDGTVFINADGSLGEGQVPGVKEFPQIASLVNVDGEWIVDRLTRDERACA